MTPLDSLWIVGASRSGKTARLVEVFCAQAAQLPAPPRQQPYPPVLVFAATGDNRFDLSDRLSAASRGQVAFESATPLGFFESEVTLFYPLLAEKLDLKNLLPLRLRPETEQELATRLWREALDEGQLEMPGVPEYYRVRRLLDLLQLAALSGTPPEDLPIVLRDGFQGQELPPELWEVVGRLLLHWRSWCLERGLLTYGLVAELYWRYLLPDPRYQERLRSRYRAVFADDLDEYPAIACPLFTLLLNQGIPGVFTCNPAGSLRLGLGADPEAMLELRDRCSLETLPPPAHTLGTDWGTALTQWVQEPILFPELSPAFQSIQTTSRAELLRQTAETVATAIHSGQVSPQEVAIIGPGLDAIARYTLREILTHKGIAVESLNDQQPLASSPVIRSLLTLLALVYPGLGRLLTGEAIAELLIVLSNGRMRSRPLPADGEKAEAQGPDISSLVPGPLSWDSSWLAHASSLPLDPVRAGLLIDHCFCPHPEEPQLLPATAFSRWDRLGYQATQSYESIRQWVELQRQQLQQRLIPNPITLLDRAIQQFFAGGSHLPYDQLAALRELMETAQHYWEIDGRLRQSDPQRAAISVASTVADFIQLLRNGTITADPYPTRPFPTRRAVTLATIFQYRAQRCAHRWQFWLDAGSALWLTGGGPLFGAPLLLKGWNGRPWTPADDLQSDQQRLSRQILDLLYRVAASPADEPGRVYLCHSDLATSGQEQSGPLLMLVNAATPVNAAEPLNFL